MRNLLSLIEAVAQGQAWFADLLWSRIFFSAYSLGWDSETAGRAWQCATEDRWWLIWLSPAQLWTWGLSRRYTKGNSVQLGSAAKRARGAEKQTPELLKTLASQRPAQPLRHSGVCAGLLSWVGTAPGLGTITSMWLLPRLVWSCHTSLRATKRQGDQQREYVMDVSFCLSSQPALSPGQYDYSHGQTAWRCTTEPRDKTGRLQSRGSRLWRATPRVHQPDPMT